MAKKLTTSVFSYLDFREYLRDVFQENKEKNRFFTHRYFAKLAGLGSYSYLRMVIKGERNLTTNSVNKIVRALKLNKKESAYFENLAYFNQIDAVHRTRFNAEIATGTFAFNNRMHEFGCPKNGIHGAGGDAFGAANTFFLPNKSDLLYVLMTVGFIKR